MSDVQMVRFEANGHKIIGTIYDLWRRLDYTNSVLKKSWHDINRVMTNGSGSLKRDFRSDIRELNILKINIAVNVDIFYGPGRSSQKSNCRHIWYIIPKYTVGI